VHNGQVCFIVVIHFLSSLLPYCQLIHLCSSLTFSRCLSLPCISLCVSSSLVSQMVPYRFNHRKLQWTKVQKGTGSYYSALSKFFESKELYLETFITQTVEEKTVGRYDSAIRKCTTKLPDTNEAMSKKVQRAVPSPSYT
jgi:hypothetical protein